MVLSILTPIIFILLRNLKYYLLIILFLCYITGFWPSISGFSIISTFYFSLGAYFSIHNLNLIMAFGKYKKICYAIWIFLLSYLIFINSNVPPQNSLSYTLFIIFSVISIINLTTELICNRILKVSPLLIESTFFIYAFHIVYGTQLAYLLLNLLFPNMDNYWDIQLLQYVLKPILTIVISLMLFCVLKRLFPKTLNVLVGNRINS